MIPLINHDSSEVAVRSLQFTQSNSWRYDTEALAPVAAQSAQVPWANQTVAGILESQWC